MKVHEHTSNSSSMASLKDTTCIAAALAAISASVSTFRNWLLSQVKTALLWIEERNKNNKLQKTKSAILWLFYVNVGLCLCILRPYLWMPISWVADWRPKLVLMLRCSWQRTWSPQLRQASSLVLSGGSLSTDIIFYCCRDITQYKLWKSAKRNRKLVITY